MKYFKPTTFHATSVWIDVKLEILGNLQSRALYEIKLNSFFAILFVNYIWFCNMNTSQPITQPTTHTLKLKINKVLEQIENRWLGGHLLVSNTMHRLWPVCRRYDVTKVSHFIRPETKNHRQVQRGDAVPELWTTWIHRPKT